MNAYELADKLQMDKAKALVYVDTVVQSAVMLRQQADLIKQASQFIQEQGLERQWIVWSTLKKASEK